MSDAVIDPAALNRLLSAIGGDTEDLAELVDDFIEIGPQLIGELRAAEMNQDWSAMRVSAHSFKSNAREFGAGALEGLCQSLEQQCHAGTVSQAGEQIEAISSAFDQASAALASLQNT